ncbi:DUF4389 domain-containing protein [Pseudomonadota bacterium]
MNTDNNNIVAQPQTIWQRGLYMLLFAFLIGIAKVVAFSVVCLQFLLVLFSGKPNEQLLEFGKSLSIYTYQIMLFLTFNREEHPYPFTDWPK